MKFSIQYNNSTIINVETFNIKGKLGFSIQVAISFSQKYINKSNLKMFFTNIDFSNETIKKHILKNQSFYVNEYDKFLKSAESIKNHYFQSSATNTPFNNDIIDFVFKHGFHSIDLYNFLFSDTNPITRDSTIKLLSEQYFICFDYFKKNVFVKEYFLSEFLYTGSYGDQFFINNSFLIFIHKLNKKYQNNVSITYFDILKEDHVICYFLENCIHNDSLIDSVDFLITHYSNNNKELFKFISSPLFSKFIYDILFKIKPLKTIQQFATIYGVSVKLPLVKFIDIYYKLNLGYHIYSRKNSDELLSKHIMLFNYAINFYAEEQREFVDEHEIYNIIYEMISHISEIHLQNLLTDKDFNDSFKNFHNCKHLIEQEVLKMKLKNF